MTHRREQNHGFQWCSALGLRPISLHIAHSVLRARAVAYKHPAAAAMLRVQELRQRQDVICVIVNTREAKLLHTQECMITAMRMRCDAHSM